MARSPESVARRREYSRRWWAENGKAYRARRGATKRAVTTTELPALHSGHDLFDQARAATGIGKDERSRTVVRRDAMIREDGLSEAVLAILEHRDPEQAWKSFRSREMAWVYRTTTLLTHDE